MTVFQTRVFQNGGSQAIRIPADLRFEEGAEVSVCSDEPLELTLIAQSAANVGTNTVLVALGQLVIGKVKSDQLEELYQAVMSTGGVARCLGTVSEIDVAKPFGVIKGQ